MLDCKLPNLVTVLYLSDINGKEMWALSLPTFNRSEEQFLLPQMWRRRSAHFAHALGLPIYRTVLEGCLTSYT